MEQYNEYGFIFENNINKNNNNRENSGYEKYMT